MTQQTINVGTLPNDGTGDPLRVAFQKCNNNFGDFYGIYATGTGVLTVSGHISTMFVQSPYLVLPTAIITLVNGLNSNINAPGSSLRIIGPVSAFSVGGFSLPTSVAPTHVLDGTRITLYNSTSQTMTIVNEDVSSTPQLRIRTLQNANVVLRAGATSSASFFYDTNEATGRWIMIGQS